MLKTINGIYQDGKFVIDETIKIPDKTTVFISFLEKNNDDFFLNASEYSLDKIWANDEDDVYEQLLKK